LPSFGGSRLHILELKLSAGFANILIQPFFSTLLQPLDRRATAIREKKNLRSIIIFKRRGEKKILIFSLNAIFTINCLPAAKWALFQVK
jgi:hypothetical protein